MTVLIKALQLILSLSLLIVLHEGGHFGFSKLFGVRVEKFYMFFDYRFRLFSTRMKWFTRLFPRFKDNETDYGIGWIPLGGYVKIAGMVDESMDAEQLKQPVRSDEFRAKSIPQRFFIMAGGVLMNLITAFVIYSAIMFSWGEDYLPVENIKDGFEFNQYAQEIGFRNGDLPVEVDGKPVLEWQTSVLRDISTATTVTVRRGGEEVIIPMPDDMNLINMLQQQPPFMRIALPEGEPRILPESWIAHRDYTALTCIPAGIRYGWHTLTGYVSDLRYVFSREGAQSVGSFITIGSIFPDKWNWYGFWNITAFLSIILAVMNVLPIPGLDGGHIALLAYEGVTGHEPSDAVMLWIERIGLGIIIALMCLAFGNDIVRFIFPLFS
ncbi:MAG: site-2 protease family protein [Bacteroidaceae bacterium]|nr:site-2 protease family protein [Bacteroidaceae bacterium]